MDGILADLPLKLNLVLIGGRGSGKSSIARRIYREYGELEHLSLDTLIRYEAKGEDIPAIVEERGWRGFRELEYQVVKKAASFKGGALIDCGGGVIVDLDDRGEEVFSERKAKALRSTGVVFYLEREPKYLFERIGDDPNRPALSAEKSFIEIMKRRDPFYRRMAHHTIRCGSRKKREIMDEVLELYRKSVLSV